VFRNSLLVVLHGFVYDRAVARGRKSRPVWDARGVRALRRHLDLTQEALARELGTRQQTVSEWETGQYRPRGISARVLSMVAERAGFRYGGGEERREREEEGEG
jgi:DNA-binding XRE family transcriptional regulator